METGGFSPDVAPQSPDWSAREIDALIHLDQDPKTGFMKTGEYKQLGILIGCSVVDEDAWTEPPKRHRVMGYTRID